MITNSISLSLKTVDESPNYDELIKKGEKWTMVEAEKVIVTKNGMENGSPTVDIQMKDADGNDYVMIITGKILRQITNTSNPLCNDHNSSLVN